MRCVKGTLGVLAVLLASCGGGGGSGGQSNGSVVVVQPPPPPPPPPRGLAIGGPTLVPASLATGATVNTLEPGQLKTLVDDAVVLGTTVTSTPVCAITTYTLKYHTIDSMGADTDASTAVMVPSGTGPACQGARPVLLYAHGTTVQKTTDMANLSATEPLLLAALFAAQGYIVVAPNYAGYAGSSLAYHAYLDATQQSSDMVDALRAARGAFAAMKANASSRLMLTGYSQGGYVALATQRAMQTGYAGEFNVTAAAPLSGPYALLLFGDAIFGGAPSVGATGFLPLVITAGQRAGAALYASTADVYEAKYASGIDTLLPGTRGFGDLVAAGKLPDDVLFAQDSLPQPSGYASFFGADHLIRTAYRDTYLADLKANPCNTSAAAPLGCAPAQPLRRWLLRNDLRTYTPTVPLFLCGGADDPVVPFANTRALGAYFAAHGATTVTALDLEENSLAAPYLTSRTQFAGAKQVIRLANKSVSDSYHAGLVAPFCLREARAFFDSAANR